MNKPPPKTAPPRPVPRPSQTAATPPQPVPTAAPPPPPAPIQTQEEPASEFPLLDSQQAIHNVLELIDLNLAGQNFSVLQLSPIKVPAAGGREFRVDGAGGSESMREIEAVIVAFRQIRAYWRKLYGTGGGKRPPNCSSTNGLVGVGDPGGSCPECPYSQWGSAQSADGSASSGQACKDMRQLLVVLPGELLPHALNLPPTSIQNFFRYSLHLVSAGVPYWGVVTKLSIEAAKSAGGIDYSRVHFQMLRRLDSTQASRIEPYHQRMAKLLAPAAVDHQVYDVEPEPAREKTGDDELDSLVSRPRHAMPYPQPDDEEVPF